MRLVIAVILTLGISLFGLSQSHSQWNGCKSGFCNVVTSAPFQGPGDAVSGITVAWGLRAFSLATTGQKVANVCDNAGANCADFLTDGNGNLVWQTLGSDNCLVAQDCKIKILYDLVGGHCSGSTNCDVTNATNSARPTLKTSDANSRACAFFASASSQALTSTNNFVSSQPINIYEVAERTSSTTSENELISSVGTPGTVSSFFTSSASTVGGFAGTAFPKGSVTDGPGHPHALAFVVNGASPNSIVVADNSSTTGSSGSNTASGLLRISLSTHLLDGYFCEGGISTGSGAWTSTQWGGMHTNESPYYATP